MTPGDTDTVTLTGPNVAWWGRLQPPGELAKAHAKVVASTAAVLDVPLDEVFVEEIPQRAGVTLVGRWCPR